MNQRLASIDIPGVWRGGQALRVEAIPTGNAGLDALLPGGGWPIGAVSELLHAQAGVGELGLIVPVLARLTQAGARIALVGPPHVPYAPALEQAGVILSRMLVMAPPRIDDTYWGVEQLLKSGVCSCVVAWSKQASEQELRRLQLAAETSRSLCLLMRPLAAEQQPSPAALRLRLLRRPTGLDVEVIKARGGRTGTHWQSA